MFTSTTTCIFRTFTVTTMVGAMAFCAGCGGDDTTSSASKGGGKGSAGSASSAGQKSGGKATGKRADAQQQGAESDGVACDGSTEGVGFCASDAEIVFCSEGSWWLLDCGAVADGAFCGLDEESNEVDCYVEE